MKHNHVAGCVPLDPNLAASLEEGKDFLELYTSSSTFTALNTMIQRLMLVDRDFWTCICLLILVNRHLWTSM